MSRQYAWPDPRATSPARGKEGLWPSQLRSCARSVRRGRDQAQIFRISARGVIPVRARRFPSAEPPGALPEPPNADHPKQCQHGKAVQRRHLGLVPLLGKNSEGDQNCEGTRIKIERNDNETISHSGRSLPERLRNTGRAFCTRTDRCGMHGRQSGCLRSGSTKGRRRKSGAGDNCFRPLIT